MKEMGEMRNNISRKIRNKMLNVIEEIEAKDNVFIANHKDMLLNMSDDDFFKFIFDNLDLKNRKDMDEVMLLYMRLNMYLSKISYEIYITKKDIKKNEYEYGYRKKVSTVTEKKIPFFISSFPDEYPAFYLTTDNWDDYFYKTTFYLSYVDEQKNDIFIGDIKILKLNTYTTKEVIPNKFYELSEEYHSLGQSINFYTKLSFFVPEYEKILNCLNDIAIDPEKKHRIEKTDGFQNSLIRFSEARKALDETFKYESTDNTFSFNYEFSHMKYRKDRRSNPITIEFNFDKHDILPYRINAIIGKNGVGKTQIIKNLSEEISGMMFSDDKELNLTYKPIKVYPNFSKIITVSYSAFDDFRKMEGLEKSKFNYVYCGLYKIEGQEDKRLSIEEIKKNILDAKYEIEKRGRKEEWFNSIRLISESTDIVGMIEIAETIEDIQLSSGELVILSCITDIIKYISEESLILFDEPELHLHPNAVSNFMRMFNNILETYDSYAIVSTHSPIIIQEIPSRNVNIILRENDYTMVRRLGIECFGESIDNINKDVFYFNKSSLNYKKKLEDIIQNNSYEKIVEQFDDKLSLNAKIYLKILENQKEK